MARRCGFTLMELMVVTVASSAVLIAVAGMYAYIMSRLSADASESTLFLQSATLDSEIQRVVQVSSSVSIVTVGGFNCLKCAVPSGGTDKNLDGVVDNAMPNSVDSSGNNAYTANRWVWFYMGDASGNPSSSGTQLWRAVLTSSSSIPSGSNKDSGWSLSNGNPRFNLVESFSATVNPTAETATVTCTFSALTRADRVGTGESMVGNVTRITTSRTYFWGDPR
ncbi:MAG TPA: prepilin-type N-terminal cleavage/methylation domain-containing protein [Fimbriimonadaceae bacterium]|nr:prepilin-type N-terminal cleavage/methylation domain-containing protein [Fimbriimonadaceae bacterium]